MNMPLNASRWGFSPEEISFLDKVSSERARYLEETDAKGREMAEVLKRYSALKTDTLRVDGPEVVIGSAGEISDEEREELCRSLMTFQPWRKGPFELFGVGIDSEWRSDLKWERVKGAITPLAKRHVLDIGSSNGYYMFRMLEQDPAMVMGIEPYTNFYFQFRMLNSAAGIENIFTLPLRFEDITDIKKKFNTVFCMGILYHRRSPVDFLIQIRKMMAGDGELVLETLILQGEEHIALAPEERYAKMPNVYFIPTLPVLFSWLRKAGFRELRCIDVTPTTLEEQRRTEWIRTESLPDFLDPGDSSKTIEGYPAPVRGVVVAHV